MSLEHFDRFIATLRIELGLSPNTIMAYSRDLARLADSTQGDPTHHTPEALAASVRTMAHHAPASVARYIAVLRAFYGFLLSEGIIDTDPTALLEAPHAESPLPVTVSATAVRHIVGACDSTPAGTRDRCLIEFLYGCGMRASEAAGLKLEQIHRRGRFVQLSGKGGRERVVPYGVPAAEALGEYLRTGRPALARPHSPGAVWLSRTGRALERHAIYLIVRERAEAAGYEGVSPHVLRHSFATHMVANGVDLRVVQELLGHALITTTEVYAHVDPGRLREVVRKYHPRG